jgi:hypothetical protein
MTAICHGRCSIVANGITTATIAAIIRRWRVRDIMGCLHCFGLSIRGSSIDRQREHLRLKTRPGRGALPWRQALRCQTAPRHGVLAPTAAGTGEQIKSRKIGGRKTAPLNDAVNSVPFGNSMVNAVYSQITQERDRVDHIALAGGITANETSASRRVELEMLL